MLRAFAAAFACIAGLSAPAWAQTATPSWLDRSILEEARKEGSVTVYSTTNEEEGLPLWKIFEDATGLKVNYVRKIDAETGRLLCTGTVIHAGRTMFTADARVVDENGKLYAHGSGTFLVYPT